MLIAPLHQYMHLHNARGSAHGRPEWGKKKGGEGGTLKGEKRGKPPGPIISKPLPRGVQVRGSFKKKDVQQEGKVRENPSDQSDRKPFASVMNA
jgi:hypothetical protein